MNILLHRIRHRPDTIDSILKIDGVKVCDSAENTHHCLPPGEYSIILARRHPKDRKMPVILSERDSHSDSTIPDGKPSLSPSLSQLSYGNGVYALRDGTILLGRYLAPGIVTHSRPAFDALYQRIRKNLERGNEVNLIIK